MRTGPSTTARAAVLAVGVGLEVLALGTWAGLATWSVVTGSADAPGPVIGLALTALVLAAVLVLATRAALRTGSGPARALVVTWQLVQAGTAGSVLGAGVTATVVLTAAWAGVGLAVVVVGAALADARARAGPQ